MRFLFTAWAAACWSVLACASTSCRAADAANTPSPASKPVRFVLVGDSTMANTTGYGDALCARIIRADTCINLAKGGRSSASFRAEGRWDEVQGLLRGSTAYRATYVLIQFGHNDQPGKPGRSTDLATEFPVNIARYVQEVRALGGIPVLLTPLTRRTFKNGVLENGLQPWADVIRATAASQHVPLLDLNNDSYAAVQAMGQDEADTLAMAPRPEKFGEAVETNAANKTTFDRTHVGAKGSALFSGMVEQELKRALPETAREFKSEERP